MNAIDTNVLAYLFDPNEPVKQRRANEFVLGLLSESEECVLLWQVGVELVACLRKYQMKGFLSAEDVKIRFQEMVNSFRLQLPTASLFELSFTLHERYSLSHWDSLLLAACRDAGVTRLYSEDLQHGGVYDGVVVENPFLS